MSYSTSAPPVLQFQAIAGIRDEALAGQQRLALETV